MGGIEIDGRELNGLAVDLSRAELRIQLGAKKVVKRGAEIIDAGMTADATGHIGNYFGIPGTEYSTPLEQHVSHEMVGELEAEIGIEDKGAGKLAHIIVYGSINNAPVYDHTAPLRRSAPLIAELMGKAGEDAVLGGES